MRVRIAALAAAAAFTAATASSIAAARSLPAVINAGYVGGDACNTSQVMQAARSGLNLLFWFSINLGVNNVTGRPEVQGGPDLSCVARVTQQLRAEGLATTHMISVGGWDAPHPPTVNPPADVYREWKRWNEEVVAPVIGGGGFDGLDWDLEGNDNLTSSDNYFTVPCLDLVGQVSSLAKRDGYIVSLVPPESYLDSSTSAYDRNLTWAYPDGWQPGFHYHGHNAYAYLLARYPATTFDFISTQLYETYSHADFNITVLKQSPSDYVTRLVQAMTGGWWVDFASDPASRTPSQRIAVNASRLVIALANGWAGSEKSILIMPQDAGKAYAALQQAGIAPRGFAFWTIANEGSVPVGQTQPLYMAAGLNAFLHTRA